MKKFYSLLTLLMVSLTAFMASAAKTVTVECSNVEALELRDGGPDGEILPVEASPAQITINSDALYIGLADDSKILKQITYTCTEGYAKFQSVTTEYFLLPVSDMYEGNVSINIAVETPIVYTVNVDDPSLINIKTSSFDTTSFNLVQGKNEIKVAPYTGLYIELTDPVNYRLTKVWRVSDDKSYKVEAYSKCSLGSWEISAGDEISYTIVPASEFTAPTFTLTVDNPDALNISIDYVERTGFVANEPTEIEMSGSETDISVNCKNYDDEIYQITVNGEVQTSNYFKAHENDNVVITHNFPEIYKNITLVSDPAENIDAVASVKVAGTEVENWKETFPAQQGKKLQIDFNTDFYMVSDVTINGEPETLGYYGNIETRVTDDMTISFKAEKYPTLTATVNVNHPEYVTVRLSSKELSLEPGANTIEFTSNSASLSITTGGNRYSLDVVNTTINGETNNVLSPYGTYLTLQDGMIIDIEASCLPLEEKIVLYSSHASDDKDVFGNFSFYTGLYVTVPAPAGYSTFAFNEEKEKSFNLAARDNDYQNVPTFIYINGEEGGEMMYGSYYLDVADGDVVKLFFFDEPETYTADFDIEEGCEVEVVKDLYTQVADLTAGITDFEGTLVQLRNTNAETPIDVYVAAAEAAQTEDETPGDALEADEDGNYNVTLDGTKKITVALHQSSGVESVVAAEVANRDVYTLTGILLISNASDAQLNALPAGIYVVGGKKLVIR